MFVLQRLRAFVQRLPDYIAHLVVRRRVYVALTALLLVGACVLLVTSRQRLDSEVLNLLPKDSESVQALKVFNSEFEQGRELIFVLKGTPEQVEEKADEFADLLTAEPWVRRVFSGAPLEQPEELTAMQALIPHLLLNLDPDAFSEVLKSLQPEAIDARVARIRADVETGSPRGEFDATIDPLGLVTKALRPLGGGHGMERGQLLVSEDGTVRLFPVITDQATLAQADCKATMEKVAEFTKRVESEWATTGGGPKIMVTGRTAYVDQIAESMARDVELTSMVSLICVTGLFFIGFRRLIPPISTSVILGMSCFVSFSVGCLLFENLNMIAIAFCSILVGLGDDFSLLLYNRYLLARRQGEGHEQGIATSIRHTAPGILYVAFTTGGGFSVLLLSTSAGFAQLGALIALGIVLCAIFIITLVFIFIRPKHAHPELPDPLHPFFQGLVNRLIHSRKALTISGCLLLAGPLLSLSLPGAGLHFDTNPRSLEPRDIPAAVALRTINEHISAAAEPVLLLLQSPDAEAAHRDWRTLDKTLAGLVENGTLASYSTPAALMLSPARIAENQQRLRSVDLEKSHAAFTHALQREQLVPESFENAFELLRLLKESATSKPGEIQLEGALPESSAWWFLLDRYISNNPLIAAAYLRPANPIASVEDQQRIEQQIKASGVNVQLTGWSYSMVGLVPWAKRELIWFSTAVGALVTLCLAAAYRSWKPLFVHLALMIMALGLCVFLLGIMGVKLNLLNALAFPLTLGVGIDYGMHLVIAVRSEHDHVENVAAVVKPVLISGLTTIAGFGALVFAENPALQGLGTVCATGVACCLVTSLFIGVPMMAWLSNKELQAIPDGPETA